MVEYIKILCCDKVPCAETHVPFRAEGGAERVSALGVYTKIPRDLKVLCAETHVPFRAEVGAKRVFALGVYTKILCSEKEPCP